MIQKNNKRNQKQGFIKIQEHVAASMFELEVVESEDCTQEMDDIVGNINMMETGYGNLTGMNRHLAKEKSHIFDEAQRFFKQHKREAGPEFGSMDFEEAMNNHSMILPNGGSFIMNNRSMTNFGGSQIFNSDFQSSPNNPAFLQQSQMYNGQNFRTGHTRMQSGANRSQVMNNTYHAPAENHSMYMNGNFNQTMNSQVFSNGQGYPGQGGYRQRPQQQGYGRRGTIRASVLQTYNKLTTMNQGVNQSMISSRYSHKNLDVLNEEKKVSIYTRSNVSNLERNRVNI